MRDSLQQFDDLFLEAPGSSKNYALREGVTFQDVAREAGLTQISYDQLPGDLKKFLLTVERTDGTPVAPEEEQLWREIDVWSSSDGDCWYFLREYTHRSGLPAITWGYVQRDTDADGGYTYAPYNHDSHVSEFLAAMRDLEYDAIFRRFRGDVDGAISSGEA